MKTLDDIRNYKYIGIFTRRKENLIHFPRTKEQVLEFLEYCKRHATSQVAEKYKTQRNSIYNWREALTHVVADNLLDLYEHTHTTPYVHHTKKPILPNRTTDYTDHSIHHPLHCPLSVGDIIRTKASHTRYHVDRITYTEHGYELTLTHYPHRYCSELRITHNNYQALYEPDNED